VVSITRRACVGTVGPSTALTSAGKRLTLPAIAIHGTDSNNSYSQQENAPSERDKMRVHIKDFDVAMEVKTNGIEFEVRSPDDAVHHGDCILTKTNIIWCSGRTTRPNGLKITWDDFMTICSSEDTLKAAIKAAEDAA
jgi:hypothetical protein